MAILFEEFVGDLQQDPTLSPIFPLHLFPARCSRFSTIFRAFSTVVAFDAFAVDDCSDTTVIMLKLLSI